MKPGKTIDMTSKKVIGEHQGVLYYTVGQRKGLDIGGKGGPWFVVGKNIYKNELYVANASGEDWLVVDNCIVNQFNWLLDVEDEIECCAKFRYRQADNPVFLKKINETTVECSYPQGVKSVTPGQEAVFYLGDKVIGGGVIDQVFKQGEDLMEKINHEVEVK